MTLEEFYLRGMKQAYAEAERAAGEGEVPAGCVILPAPPDLFPDEFDDPDAPPLPAGSVLGRAHNQTEALRDATAHAEMVAITQAAAAIGDWRLTRTVLFTTKEPCAMCAGAIVLSRVPIVVYGLPDPKRGGQSVFGILGHPDLVHRVRVVPGILEEECREQLVSFFRARRAERQKGGREL